MNPDHDTLIARLRQCTKDTGVAPFYDAMSDGLVWPDETPPRDYDVLSITRFLWHHRARLIQGLTTSRYQTQWDEGLRLFPEWIGFHPSRTSPNPQLAWLFESKSKSFGRSLQACPETESLAPDDIRARFGEHWNAMPLFYHDRRALRFELGVGDESFSYYVNAFQRAMQVLSTALSGASDLHLALEYGVMPDDRDYNSRTLLGIFHQLKSVGIPRPSRKALFKIACHPSLERDSGDLDYLALIPINWHQLPKAVWSAVMWDSTIRPAIVARHRVLSLSVGLQANIYDHRGMDVTGPNTNLLQNLHTTHRSMLFDHDLKEMDARYKRHGDL
jgi:hypothetical protein